MPPMDCSRVCVIPYCVINCIMPHSLSVTSNVHYVMDQQASGHPFLDTRCYDDHKSALESFHSSSWLKSEMYKDLITKENINSPVHSVRKKKHEAAILVPADSNPVQVR